MAVIELVSKDTKDIDTLLDTMWWAAHVTFTLSSLRGQEAWREINFSGLWWFFMLTTELTTPQNLIHHDNTQLQPCTLRALID